MYVAEEKKPHEKTKRVFFKKGDSQDARIPKNAAYAVGETHHVENVNNAQSFKHRNGIRLPH